MKIVTSYIYPPIPERSFDWCATLDGYEPGDPIGYGATEDRAIRDLKETLVGADHIFTCRQCEQNFTTETEEIECPVCGWAIRSKPSFRDCLAFEVTGASCQWPKCDC
jgi:DNA-directed RNA polymerase subunit RPC12/RpoP